MSSSSHRWGRPPGRKRKQPDPNNNPPKQKKPCPVKYHCDYCRKDISNFVRIRCAVCPDFDLCLECFSVGVEIRDHKNNHSYRVMDYMSFPLFEQDWGADEELLILEAIKIFGLGNWIDICDHLGTNRTPESCRDHYFKIYIDVDTCPIPNMDKVVTKDIVEYVKQKMDEGISEDDNTQKEKKK